MSVELYNRKGHICLKFSELVKGEGIQANQFLVVHEQHAAIIDPGGNLTYNRLLMAVSQYASVRGLDYVLASHQDPDIIASANKWVISSDAKIAMPSVWERFVPHFCSPNTPAERFMGIPDQGMRLPLGDSELIALPAHFLHSLGNLQFYDPVSKILFSGDMGASAVDADAAAEVVTDMASHVANMIGFHQRYMSCNKVCRLWAKMIRQLDVEWIVPQHGPSFKGKAIIAEFLDWIENLQCGTDLMNQDDYRIPSA